MRILLTGASSFTGLWFARALTSAGHEVVAPLRRLRQDYEGLRAQRVKMVAEIAEVVYECPFGGGRFLDLASDGHWDRLCHHAAHVTDYRSPSFDAVAALGANTKGLPDVLQRMRARGLEGVVLTGSVFEPNEGAGTGPLRAFSPYGLSKGMTAETFRYWCGEYAVPLRKFVIPNPFGPFEEPRFCTYLVRSWRDGKTPEVRTPAYVRDNVHVDLLALAYAGLVQETTQRPFVRANPSGYVETQGTFARRFAAAMQERLGLDCRLELLDQTEFPEPAVRINTESASADYGSGWSENGAWDGLAAYYRENLLC